MAVGVLPQAQGLQADPRRDDPAQGADARVMVQIVRNRNRPSPLCGRGRAPLRSNGRVRGRRRDCDLRGRSRLLRHPLTLTLSRKGGGIFLLPLLRSRSKVAMFAYLLRPTAVIIPTLVFGSILIFGLRQFLLA